MLWSAWVILSAIAVLLLAAAAVCARRLWLLAGRRLRRIDGPARLTERRRVWIPAAGFLGLGVLALLDARYVEPQWVEVTRVEIAVARPVLGRPRLRVVHLSDIHIERFGRREQDVLDAVREARPDLIVLTGDYLNGKEGRADLILFLSSLSAPLGVFGVPGNCDDVFPFPMAEVFAKGGARLLRDQGQLIGGGLFVAGQNFHPGRSLAQLTEGVPEDVFRLFLRHSPLVGDLAQGRADLLLCGHTHGGQVRLPFYGPLVTTSPRWREYDCGLYAVAPPASVNPGGTAMYVNRGIGMTHIAPPLRFLCRPEVTVIDLVAETTVSGASSDAPR